MTTQTFIQRYREAFGEQVALPIAFAYSQQALVPECKVPRCMIGAIAKVRNGQPLTLSAQNVQCGGGGLYTGFAPMQERIPHFVANMSITNKRHKKRWHEAYSRKKKTTHTHH